MLRSLWSSPESPSRSAQPGVSREAKAASNNAPIRQIART